MSARRVLLAALSFLLLGSSAATASPPPPARPPVLDWLDTQAAHFAAHPELVGHRGTGWKQYARMQHFLERRLTPEGTLPTMKEMLQLRAEHDAASRFAAKVGVQYFELGPTNIGARVVDIVFDPNVPGRIYAAAAGGGLARSDDGGDSWTMSTDQAPTLSVSAVSVDPTDSDKLLVGTGGRPTAGIGLGIFYSLDGGASWSASDLIDTTPWISVHDLEVTPNGVVHIAGTDQGIYRSTDDGATWTLVQEGGIWYDVVFTGTTMFAVGQTNAAGTGGIYRSTDAGQTWTLSGTGQPPTAAISKSRLAVSGSTIFALLGSDLDDELLGLWTSTDLGDTWVKSPTGPDTLVGANGRQTVGGQIQSGFNLALAVDPGDADKILVGAVNALVSTDGGATWAEVNQAGPNGTSIPHVDNHAAVWRNGVLWVGTDGGIFTSDDLGATFTDRNVGLGCFLYNSVAVAQTDLSVMVGGAQDNRVSQWLTATDWQLVSGVSGDGSICAVDPTNALNVYADKQRGNHYRSTDGGATFTQANQGIGDDTNGEFVNELVIDPNTPSTLYAPTSSECDCGVGLWRTVDGMQNWTKVDDVQARVIGVSKVTSNTVFTIRASDGDLRVTTDWWASATDHALPFTPAGRATDIETLPGNDGAALISYGSYSTGGLHVLLARQYGAVVDDVTGDLPDVPASALAIDPRNPSHWYVGTDLGVYRSTNAGVNWVPFGIGLPNAVVTDLMIHDSDRKLIVGTFGRGAWMTDLSSPTATPPAIAQPAHLMLDPPYPNPATHHTLLRFAAKQSGEATLDIYDAAGRRVETLAVLPADGVVRMIAWRPKEVASGVYYAVLRTDMERTMRKIVLAR
jgi:photosystem II stability/assembly factor-like uncharacterized protein